MKCKIMTQYIDKDALVAELEARISDIETSQKAGLIKKRNANNKIFLFKSVLSFINTLEVKEVDLQSEIDRVWDNTSDNFLEDGWKEFEDISKHFFELGLKAQRKSISVQNIDDVLKELGVDPHSKEAKMIKESYYTAIDKLLAQKGEKYDR